MVRLSPPKAQISGTTGVHDNPRPSWANVLGRRSLAPHPGSCAGYDRPNLLGSAVALSSRPRRPSHEKRLLLFEHDDIVLID